MGKPDRHRQGNRTPACHLPALPLVLLLRALRGTDGTSSRVPPQGPPFPKLAWALAAYARAQEDLVREVMGGALFCGCRMPVWGTQSSAKGAGAGLCPGSMAGPLSGAPLIPPRWLRSLLLSRTPHTGAPLAPPGTTSAAAPGCQRALGCQLPHPCSGVLEPSSPAS